MIIRFLEFQYIIDRYGLKIKLPKLKKNASGIDMKLYEGVKQEIITDDESAMTYLFGERDPSAAQQYYFVKNRLRGKLENAALFLNLRPELNSKATIVFARLQKKLASIKILRRLGGERNAIAEAKRGFILAQKYNLTQLALEFATMIQSYYFITGELAKYKKYDSISKELYLRYGAELEAVHAYERFGIHYFKRISYLDESKEILTDSIATVKAQLKKVDSSVCRIIYHKLLVHHHDFDSNYQSVYNTATDALLYLDSIGEKAVRSDYAEFYSQQMGSCIYTRNLADGIKAYKNCELFNQPGTSNWFVLKEFAFMLFMHCSKNEQADIIYKEATENKGFALLEDFQKQRWQVLNLYNLFIKGQLKESLVRRTKKVKELRLIIESASELQHDKPGFGFSLRLLHILFLVEKGTYDILTESIDGFKKYCIRNFSTAHYPKTRAFMLLLVLLDRYSYDSLIIEAKSKQKYQKLLDTPLGHVEAGENIQVLPYEFIWRRILDRLKADREKIAKLKHRK